MKSHTTSPITIELSLEAQKLYNELKENSLDDKKYDFVLSMLNKIINLEKLPPDDWAFAQAMLDETHPCSHFLARNRDIISRQFDYCGKKLTAVPIITFKNKGERYVLLMKNMGLEKSVEVNEIQWTAHGVRVDLNEQIFLSSDQNVWNLFKKISGNDVAFTFLLAAAVRRVQGLGISLTENDIANMRIIDRAAAGFIETSPHYRTEYFDVDLGERDPADIVKAIESSPSRFAQWTRCFKLPELKAGIKESKSPGKLKQTHIFTHGNETLPMRDTTWGFIKALEYVKSTEIKPDGITKDPWQLRNISNLDTAIRWVLQRMDSPVQFTLFASENNRLSSAQAHAYAAKAKLNEENLAYTSMKPARLVLHAIIAHLTVKVKIQNSDELDKLTKNLYRQFFENNKSFIETWENEFKKMELYFQQLIKNHSSDAKLESKSLTDEEKNDLLRINELLKTIQATELSDIHRTIYNLHENNLQIAMIIRLHEKFHAQVMSAIQPLVSKMIQEEKYEPLEKYPLSERQCFGITGPLASGKSASEKIIRGLLNTKNAAYIGSDEWNRILSEFLMLDKHGYDMHRGYLTLPEAWFIKVLIWDMIKEMEQQGMAPNWIHEACSPTAIKAPSLGKTMICLNTADPTKAAARVKERGDKMGRYVSASAASSSYRWPWLNFVKTLENHSDNVILRVFDTDILYSKQSQNEDKRTQLAYIVTVEKGVMEIHNLNHFLFFVARSFRVNNSPNQSHEVWLPKSADSLKPVLTELEKLFSSKINIKIKYNNHILSKENLFDLVNELYVKGIRPLEKMYAKRLQLFGHAREEEGKQELGGVREYRQRV